MKKYTEEERRIHAENWKAGKLSKAEYAKSAGIKPVTFYKWVNRNEANKPQSFVEIKKRTITESLCEITLEKNGVIARIPITAGMKGIQTVFHALEGAQ